MIYRYIQNWKEVVKRSKIQQGIGGTASLMKIITKDKNGVVHCHKMTLSLIIYGLVELK